MRSAAVIAAVAAVAAGHAATASASNQHYYWTMAHHDVRNSGRSSEVGPAADANVCNFPAVTEPPHGDTLYSTGSLSRDNTHIYAGTCVLFPARAARTCAATLCGAPAGGFRAPRRPSPSRPRSHTLHYRPLSAPRGALAGPPTRSW